MLFRGSRELCVPVFSAFLLPLSDPFNLHFCPFYRPMTLFQTLLCIYVCVIYSPVALSYVCLLKRHSGNGEDAMTLAFMTSPLLPATLYPVIPASPLVHITSLNLLILWLGGPPKLLEEPQPQ